ncbi:bacillithiol biosynthesis cysteine-adding enzyme BshC [Bacillus sp. FJAT-50079]|uniref:bacillithiol biosynthesis cysteine-adding enzyme BshC n=1 Tax=Bacillus sp. FJAT-50079 TaxID=2833577 RepID=UPI001BC8D0C7|nr:bacillithiol biosynthesis cysteine-adding enzyme BshC [Bacillus sp. FJAT-50079]MBS4207723.1 bacillithiol biosynthesis cysteine-adding enzyme BshC [Bacillus sp. FJAT-50079]
MKLESIVIPALNQFASLYIEQKDPVKSFFHYDITNQSVYEKRYKEVMKQTYDREVVADCIEDYMKDYPTSEKITESINKLRDPSSVVVIGGQQAGLLTGPLYTIHKIISIIKLAEQQEKQLGKPVVPVFWIAGEDHDFLEINHVYTETRERMKKISYPGLLDEKRMVSHIDYNKQQLEKWVNDVFEHFGERKYTKELLTLLQEAIHTFHTFTQFFAYLVTSLFKDYGLLIIDAADAKLRKIERPYFSRLIDHGADVTKAVLVQQALIQAKGFKQMIELNNDSANIFYYFENERILLDFDETQNRFTSKKADIIFTKEELFDLLEQYPERFSNNVVTRPLMQEWIFPSLAFIAGPGEIAYWGELKQAFEQLNMKMPPIIPRLNMTFVESVHERDAHELQLDLAKIIEAGLQHSRDGFMQSTVDGELNNILEAALDDLTIQYKNVFERLRVIDQSLIPLAEKNLHYHQKQFDYLAQKVDQSIYKKHETIINKFDRLERFLRPEGSFQERMWNIFYFLNERGPSFISDIMALDYHFDGTHKVIKI